MFCSSISLRRGDLVLGDRTSHLGECVSPKREPVCVLSDLVAHLAQVGFTILGESVSHSSESLSPKREFEKLMWFILGSPPRRGVLTRRMVSPKQEGTRLGETSWGYCCTKTRSGS